MSDPGSRQSPNPEPSPELSPPTFAARLVLRVVPTLVLGLMLGGKLAGWHWYRTYHWIDSALFLSAALVFTAGAFAGIPRLSPPGPMGPDLPSGDGAPDRAVATPTGNPRGEERPDPAGAHDEDAVLQKARDRAHRRAPSLMLAGLAIMLSSAVVFHLRLHLGALYGWEPTAPRSSPETPPPEVSAVKSL